MCLSLENGHAPQKRFFTFISKSAAFLEKIVQ